VNVRHAPLWEDRPGAVNPGPQTVPQPPQGREVAQTVQPQGKTRPGPAATAACSHERIVPRPAAKQRINPVGSGLFSSTPRPLKRWPPHKPTGRAGRSNTLRATFRSERDPSAQPHAPKQRDRRLGRSSRNLDRSSRPSNQHEGRPPGLRAPRLAESCAGTRDARAVRTLRTCCAWGWGERPPGGPFVAYQGGTSPSQLAAFRGPIALRWGMLRPACELREFWKTATFSGWSWFSPNGGTAPVILFSPRGGFSWSDFSRGPCL